MSVNNTVRYASGEMVYSITDVASGGYGLPWSHSRTFSNVNASNFDEGQGVNWDIPNQPYIANTKDEIYALLGDPLSVLWFEKKPGDDTYEPLYTNGASLYHNETSKKYTLYKSDGTKMVLNDLTVTPRPGALLSHTTPGGSTTSISYDGNGNIDYVYREYTSGSDTVREEFYYDYNVAGTHIQRVTLRRKINSGSWTNILKVEYAYYDSSSSFGGQDDLKTATQYEWDGSAWDSLGVYYYRYWLDNTSNGLAHMIKYVVEPAAYSRMEANSIDPLTASNSIVAQYADKYFEYDSQARVVKETINGGSSTYTLVFSQNPSYTPSSAGNFNFWKTKTVETLPDGTKNIVYSNNHALTILFVTQSGTDEWCEFTQFDSEGRYILDATPAAISGYDESNPDLLGYNSGTGQFQYLKNTEGLIQLYEYYPTTGSGAAYGYRSVYKIKEGQNGTAIKTQEWEYSEHSAGNATVYPVSKHRVYRNTDGTGAIETQYSYTYYSGTTQVEKKTTTLPAIPTNQNGSGASNSYEDVYDEYGNWIWHKDERGFITRYEYDIPTGAMTQQIDDVDTSQVSDEPSGWSTPAGGGLHLITDYEHDDRGRITQTLGPAHDIDLSGTSTEIRTASWTVYKDYENRQLTGQGFQKTSDDSFTLVNPVNITKRDKNGNVLEEIQATRASTSGKLQPSDTFAQTSYTRWTTYQYTECCKLESMRVYYGIPSSGEGVLNTNYNQTEYGYDLRNRRNRQVTPGGTIIFTVFDARSLTQSVYVGTDDTGATETDPTGGGAAGNNMVIVTANEYDDDNEGGNGNLTQQTRYAAASDTRVTTVTYDFRNRTTDIDGEIDYFQKFYYDNLDQTIKTERYDTNSNGNLIGREETKFDDLRRVYQTINYAVDPSTGTVGNSLTSNTWYDASGNAIKSAQPGSKLFSKMVYDGIGRTTAQYTGYDLSESTYAEAQTITDDTILEQAFTTYDDASNVLETSSYQRFHDATGKGELNGPSGTQPKARVSYTASYNDGIGRRIATAVYGTNSGSSFTRPSTVPTRSDDILVSSQTYDDAGNLFESENPAGMVTRSEYDDAGRQTKVIENYVASGTADDENRTTEFVYTKDGRLKTLTAVNSTTGNQVTTYEYGTTLTDSEVATSVLLRRTKYPDSTGTSDSVERTYNRQAQATSITDQNGSVRSFDYDKLGRMTQDRVSTLGSGVDGAVRRLSATYEVRGLAESLTSHDDATVGQGNVVNEVQNVYNSFGQLITQYQAHEGAVNISTTPKVQYAYADGSANTIRPTKLTYPDGRELNYDYGSSNGMNDVASRVESLLDNNGTTHLVDYEYLGLGSIVETDYPEPNVRNRLFDPAGSGDIYTSLDLFGRVTDCHWYDYGASSSAAQIKYGYDRDSNRTWREDVVAAANSQHWDELYVYDGLQRLQEMQRGSLNAGKTAVTNLQFAQDWSLDPLGNWSGFNEDSDGDGTDDLVQSRTSNLVNEITNITETTGPSWATPAYDAAGNMTTVPKPADPTGSFMATYDAWNRLVKLEDGTNTVQENEYDARRFRTVRKDYSGGSLSETRHLYYSAGWQSLEERLDTATDPEAQYVWGLQYIDDCVLRDRDTTANGTLDERLYGLQDDNWNMISLTDENGDVQERYNYSAYGIPAIYNASFTLQSSSSYGWEALYVGYRFDATSELFYIRNRYLNCQLGLWASRDPIKYESGDFNLYQYTHSMPCSSLDPMGLQELNFGKIRSLCESKDVQDQLRKDIEKKLLEEGLKKVGPDDKRVRGALQEVIGENLTNYSMQARLRMQFLMRAGFSTMTGARAGFKPSVGLMAPKQFANGVLGVIGAGTQQSGALTGIEELNPNLYSLNYETMAGNGIPSQQSKHVPPNFPIEFDPRTLPNATPAQSAPNMPSSPAFKAKELHDFFDSLNEVCKCAKQRAELEDKLKRLKEAERNAGRLDRFPPGFNPRFPFGHPGGARP